MKPAMHPAKPFMMVPYWLLFAPVSPGAFKLYVALLFYGNTSGVRHPSRSTLAKLCGCSCRTVNRYAEELESLMLVSRVKRVTKAGSQASNGYILNEPETIAEVATWLEGTQQEKGRWLKSIKLDQVPKPARKKYRAGKLHRVGNKLVNDVLHRFMHGKSA